MTLNDVLGLVGFTGLASSLVVCLVGCTLFSISIIRKQPVQLSGGELITHIQTGLLASSVLSLAALLLRNAYEFPIVFDAVENRMFWYQKITGLWSAQGSSLLFWCFLMAAAISITSWIGRDDEKPQRAAVSLLVLNATLLFFLFPTVFFANPFEKFWSLQEGITFNAVFAPKGALLVIPSDGAGMNPALRHVAMLLHPPFLYAGFLGFFIPYAMALSSLLFHDEDQRWIRKTYPITVGSWVCLTVGMFLGSWWAYTILGWGGYWGWDAVEISGLLPWLLSFGMIHSMTMFLRKRGFLLWNFIFTALIVILIMFGILLTRSGIIESVHAYSAGGMGPVLTGLIILHAAFWIFIFYKRRKRFIAGTASGKLEFADRLVAWFAWILLTLVLIIWIGQTLPITSRLLAGKQLSLNPVQYETATSPLFLGLLLITALFPLASYWKIPDKRFWFKAALPAAAAAIFSIVLSCFFSLTLWSQIGFWAISFLVFVWGKELVSILVSIISGKKASQIPLRSMRNKASSCLIHLGIAILACGILAVEVFTIHQDVCLHSGDKVRMGNLTLAAGSIEREAPEDLIPESTLMISISGNGTRPNTIAPSLAYYAKHDLLYGRPAIHSSLLRDVYIVLNNWPTESEDCVQISISILPLISWIWAGGMVMSAGGLMQLIGLKRSQFSVPHQH